MCETESRDGKSKRIQENGRVAEKVERKKEETKQRENDE
jgi:hypothetical protein